MSPRRPRQPDYVRSQEEIERMAAEDRAWYDQVRSMRPSDYPEYDAEKGAYDKAAEEPMPTMFARETALMDLAPAERYAPLIEHNMNQVRHIMFALGDHQREITRLRSGTRQVLARLSAAA